MSHKLTNQKGFAAIEAVLLVVILAIIGGTGYYVYQANNKSTDTQNAAQLAAESAVKHTSKKPTASQYVTIKEWGVRAKYSGSLSLTYTIKTDSAGLTSALFSSTQLDATDPSCKGGGFGGAVTQYKSGDEYLQGDSETDSGKTAAQTAASLAKSTFGHVGDYYYFYSSPQANCSQSDKTTQTQTMSAVKALLPKLEAVPTN